METLSGLNLREIEKITDSLCATKFRARQIHNWIYLKSVKEIDEMTDLSKKFREELKKVATVTDIKIKVKVSQKQIFKLRFKQVMLWIYRVILKIFCR